MKFYKVIIFSFLISVNSFSQCITGDCNTGTGTFLYPSGLKYVGEFFEGVRHGSGVLTYSDGTTYTGNFKYDKAHGFGSRTYADGSYCEGEWQDDLMYGNGFLQISNGAKYDGYFEKGVMKFGVKTIIDEKGKYRWIGTFKPISDVPKHHQIKNSFTFAFDGYGSLLMQPNDSSFVFILGEFKNEYIHGEACYFETGGYHKIGIWEDNEFIEPWPTKHQSKSVFYDTECISGNCVNGFGIKTYSPGHKYIGEFKNGKQHGKGMLIRQSGALFYSDFKEDVMNGSAIMLFANGAIFEGEIVDNAFGEGTYIKYDE